MKREDLSRVAEAFREPMAAFVRESRVRTALLVNRSGQILAHHGFDRGFDVSNVAALAAAAHSSSHALAELTGAGQWMHLHHAGQEHQLFLAPFQPGGEELVLVAIFDQDSTLGLVQLFFDRLAEAAREIPELGSRLPASDAAAFERDLEAGIERLLSDPEDS
ncbi:MAG TPA: roadblock/LC7 domain-containing protein [Longimicrobiales bacterium]|nr:roadblock/LC7 domain-containing protein [Longimicrobiales bacterium]